MSVLIKVRARGGRIETIEPEGGVSLIPYANPPPHDDDSRIGAQVASRVKREGIQFNSVSRPCPRSSSVGGVLVTHGKPSS